MKAVVYSFTRRGAMLSINIGEALQKFDFEVRCLTMPKFAEEMHPKTRKFPMTASVV